MYAPKYVTRVPTDGSAQGQETFGRARAFCVYLKRYRPDTYAGQGVRPHDAAKG
jgi:hypothetical protein